MGTLTFFLNCIDFQDFTKIFQSWIVWCYLVTFALEIIYHLEIISSQLLLSSLFLPVLRLEHQGLDWHRGRQGGDGGRGQGQEEGGPRSEHSDSLHLGQPPRSASVGGVGGVGGGVVGDHVLAALELQEGLRAAHLQAGLTRHLLRGGPGALP